jgi:hypothetical protein
MNPATDDVVGDDVDDAGSPVDNGGSPVEGAPTFATEFTSNDGQWGLQLQPSDAIRFGVPNAGAGDGAVSEIVLHGNPSLDSSSLTGPEFATQIETKTLLSFGTYRTRVKLASCASNEEVVNGIFTYANDGLDHNGNGIIDNQEIDIEILCGEPSFIWLTIWTDYDDDTGEMHKFTRAVDTATGDIHESPSDDTFGVLPIGNDPTLKIPGFPDPNKFYEMGFDWHPTNIRYFIVVGGKEYTLWDFKQQYLIPQTKGQFMFNVWHSADHWYSNDAADYPASNAVMQIDWFKYWASSR